MGSKEASLTEDQEPIEEPLDQEHGRNLKAVSSDYVSINIIHLVFTIVTILLGLLSFLLLVAGVILPSQLLIGAGTAVTAVDMLLIGVKVAIIYSNNLFVELVRAVEMRYRKRK